MVNAFIAKGLIVGGIMTFKVGERPKYSKLLVKSDIFELENYNEATDEYKFWENKQYVFGKNSAWCNPELTLQLKFKVDILLKGYLELKGIDFSAHLSIYKNGFSTCVFWIDLIDQQFDYYQIVEIITLITGGFGKSNERIITAYLKEYTKNFQSFKSLFELLQNELNKCFYNTEEHLESIHIYPITYVLEVPDCKSSDDIIEKYGKEVTGLCDAWTNYHQSFKKSEVNKVLSTDLHPFDYGVSIYTSTGMVELHSTNFKELQTTTKYSLKTQHFYELIFLCIICEISLLNLFVLVWYNKKLSQAAAYSFAVRFNFLTFIKEFKNINKLYHSTVAMLDLFSEVHFISKSYITRTTQNINQIIGVQSFSEVLILKLNDMKQQISLGFSIVTTIFVIILTIMSLAFTIPFSSVFQAF